MTEIKLRGLVIKSVDIKESDRLITIYTHEMGIVNAMAKGARSFKSRKMSSTILFCYSDFVLYQKGEYYWVREAELIDSFFGLRENIERLALASYICEVLCHVGVSQAENDLLRLALNSLFAISSDKYLLKKIKAVFEIRCASIIGFMPDVLACQTCGEKAGDFYLNVMGGYVTCLNCQLRQNNNSVHEENFNESNIVCILSEGAKTAMAYAVFAPLEKIFSFNISDTDLDFFCRACEEYLLNQLERGFKSLDFYKEVSV